MYKEKENLAIKYVVGDFYIQDAGKHYSKIKSITKISKEIEFCLHDYELNYIKPDNLYNLLIKVKSFWEYLNSNDLVASTLLEEKEIYYKWLKYQNLLCFK